MFKEYMNNKKKNDIKFSIERQKWTINSSWEVFKVDEKKIYSEEKN